MLDSHELTLRMGREIHDGHPDSFGTFFRNWIILLQTFVFPKYVTHYNPRRINESATLNKFSEDNENVFAELDWALISELVRQRYVRAHVLGHSPADDHEFVEDSVRWATDYLRHLLNVDPSTVIGLTHENSGETGQKSNLATNRYFLNNRPFSALVVLLYRIRCNLFHGVKGYRNRSTRDEALTGIGAAILQSIIVELQRIKLETEASEKHLGSNPKT
jgi:hypothetical protein